MMKRTGVTVWPGFLIVGLVRGYRLFVSPFLPQACRFHPTCSQYMIEAVTKYGAIRGVFMGARRLLRCHPFSPGGYDPVQ
jgi:putative membrane protein insertion efficiency factor